MAAVAPLFAALVDDAGLFPPERLPLDGALARHRADRATGHPVLSHRFLCPASALPGLHAALGDDESLRLGLIVDTGLGSVPEAVQVATRDRRVRLETVEVALPSSDLRGAASRHAPDLAAVGAAVYVELPRADGWRAALDALAAHGLGAKIRCGGVRAELFPTTSELAAFVCAAVADGVPFKATAGLHHAVRATDPRTGFTHHGFVNLLVAVVRAVQHGATEAVHAALTSTDARMLAGAARATPDTVAGAARRALVAYGSCSTSEPLDDLRALGLI